jgi:hypothetical protein
MTTTETTEKNTVARQPKRRSAERPHLLTILISLGACLVSTLSYVQSREAVGLARGVSQASVEVTSITLLEAYQPGEPLKAELQVTNLGKLSAKDVSVVLTSFIGNAAQLAQRSYFLDQAGSVVRFAELPPGASRTVRTQFRHGESSDYIINSKLTVALYGRTLYSDLTGKNGSDIYAFCISPITKDDLNPRPFTRCQTEPEVGPWIREQQLLEQQIRDGKVPLPEGTTRSASLPSRLGDLIMCSGGMTISPGTIRKGESAHLYWSTTDATIISITPGIGFVLANGDIHVSPTETTTYTMAISNPFGGFGKASVRLVVK